MNHQIATIGLIIACAVGAARAETFEGDVIHHWPLDDQAAVDRHWSDYTSPNTTGSFDWQPDAGRDGSGALHIKSDGPKTALWQVNVPIVPGARYEFSAWVKMDGEGFSYLAGRHKDAAGKWCSTGSFNSRSWRDEFVERKAGWTKLRVRFKAPSNGERVFLFLSNRMADGDDIWFDDVAIKEAVGPQVERDGPGFAADIAAAWAQLKAMGRSVSDELEDDVLGYPRRIREHASTLRRDRSIEARRAAWDALAKGARLRRRLARRAQFAELDRRSNNQAVGTRWVSSMQRVFIDDIPLPDNHTGRGALAMFPGEQEAAQLVLVPFEEHENLSVRVKVRTEQGHGKALRAEHIHWHPVGYVKIDKPGFNYRKTEVFPYRGWWPDPLLNTDTFALETGHYQPIWVQVDAPRDAAPGMYRFDVQVVQRTDTAGGHGKVIASSPLRVTLHEAPVMPEQWQLGTMFSFSTRIAREGDFTGSDETYTPYGERWPEVRGAYFDMLIDYRIGLGSFYESIGTYPIEWLKRADERGQNVFFTTEAKGRYNNEGQVVISKHAQAGLRELFGPTADMLEKHGLLQETYYYGFDEQWPWFFDLAADIFKRAKRRGFRTMSTIHDQSYGNDSVLGPVLDVFVDAQKDYMPDRAAKARAEGRDVWVYTTADFNIETDPIYQRLRMWDVMRMKAGGYLIWCMNRWVGNDAFIDGAIRNDWNALLDGGKPHSSAMMIYPGEDGPVSSIRLENARDGIEDYDLLAQAAKPIRRDGETSREAQVRLLERVGVTGEFQSMRPADVRAFRQRLVDRQGEAADASR